MTFHRSEALTALAAFNRGEEASALAAFDSGEGILVLADTSGTGYSLACCSRRALITQNGKGTAQY